MRQLDVVYIAGFFDGEGSVGLYASSKARRYNLRACLTQVRSTESDQLFELILKLFGGKLYYSRQYKPQHRPAMMWSLYGDAAANFLKVLRPYLRLKRRDVDLVISWQKKFGSSKQHKKDPNGWAVLRRTEAEAIRIAFGRTKGPARSY